MKRQLGLSSILGGSAVVLMSTQPAWAAATQVTAVQINQANGGIEVILQTRNGDRPQIFTVNRGNALIADLINTQLNLSEGNGFVQNNPAPGISSVVVNQLDANSVRVTVNGETNPPSGAVVQTRQGIVLSFSPVPGGQTAQAAPPTAIPQTTAPSAPVPAPAARTPDVMVPNPQISIGGVPSLQPSQAYVPPLQPRAIAPPLGDIAISNIDTSPSSIDLGTAERVPRLVLRDAPVRDVLSLLARAAGLNVAYIGSGLTQGADAQAGGATEGNGEVRISLDIENEPVQNVFNYVLRVSGLEANRTGRTIFVGPRLPDEARNVVARSLRLNQVSASDAANFLTTQGAETQISRERIEVQTFGEGAAARTVEIRTPEILALRAEEGRGPLLLRGLAVSTNQRLNTITLVGSPRAIEIASGMLAQLDLRQRQVAVNVKIVDVNLIATEDFSTSFSFGIGDGFFTSDGGAGSVRYGSAVPPSTGDLNNSRLNRPITAAPFPPGIDGPFFDAQSNAPFGSNQSTGSPNRFFREVENPDGTTSLVPADNPNFPQGVLPRAPFGTDSNPLQPGITDIADDGRLTIGLPELFQYPRDFLASLQAQVVSGNAKILTDPTIIVQEGERAIVQLTEQIPVNVVTTTEVSDGGLVSSSTSLEIEDAGVILDVIVERIDDNGFVTLSVEPTVSAPSETRTFQDTEVTFLQERRLQTGRIRVRDGQTLILSGIIQDSDRTEISKVPILGDIPLLGALFRSTNRVNERNEVIILMTLQVLDDSDQSSFGYRYSPGRDVQQILQRQGVPLQ